MSVSKYKFVSPGVFVNEIDNSQLPGLAPAMGPVVIGRTERGPSMRPVSVNSFSEYIEVFGDPVPGGRGGDVWRDGNYTSPMYATYAAQAWLRNGQTATVIRLLGSEHDNKTDAGKAGWGNYTRLTEGGGSYGLFLIDSGSATSALTGTLAAVWYFPNGNGAIKLSGTIRASGTLGGFLGNGTLLSSDGGSHQFKAVVTSGSATSDDTEKIINFNFDSNSDMFVRKVFNTNPILTNTAVTETANQEKYWLGHSFGRSVQDTLSNSGKGAVHGVILGLKFGSTDFSTFKQPVKAAKTGWIFSQDMRGSSSANFDARSTTYVTKLFQFHSLDGGDWENRNLKVSITNIKASANSNVDEFGSFDVQLRRAHDTDNAVQIIEQYNNCSLNPNSPNYLARKVGDTYSSWDSTERRFRTYGDYSNISNFVRVEMNEEVSLGATDPALIPFGFWGPYRPISFTVRQGATHLSGGFLTQTFATSSALTGSTIAHLSGGLWCGGDQFDGEFIYPAIALRTTSIDSLLSNDRAAYFGYDSRKSGSADEFDKSNIDVLRMLPDNKTDSETEIEISTTFTLDDLKIQDHNTSGKLGTATHVSGSRATGNSATALTGNYTCIIDDHGFNKFTVPMWGGHDGWNIAELDPIANRNLDDGSGEKTNYTFNTVRRAIDACSNPEMVDFNLMVAPGVTNTSLTDLMVSTCEDRGDALAIIDLPDVYAGQQEGTGKGAFASRLGTFDTIVTTFKNRKKNSSYGCTYYPWVQVRDSVNNAVLWVPPSVVALGTFASSDRIGELWFAPAGFNRGGLSQGSAGLTVTNITERLTSNQRDKLYENNINPIASFPNEGIVIFGQKTLDATTSALSRINVRRLLIFLKKEISRLANQVLFDQNVAATWGRFQALVRPVLESVKIRFGLTDYKLLLDETTTTPDLIDRNIMYAKIFLKPARAIEFIALDFVITRTGAAFED